MSYKLFLDDLRYPKSTYPEFSGYEDFWKDIKIARSYSDAVDLLNRFGLPEVLMLDYNLGEIHNGMDFVTLFIEIVESDPSMLPADFEYYIHTNSDSGRYLMNEALSALMKKLGR